MTTGTIIQDRGIEGVGRVYLVDYGDDVYGVTRVDAAGNVTSHLDDLCLIGMGEAVGGYLQALDDLCWQATPAGRHAAWDLTIDDVLRGRDAHPAGKGGGHG